MKTPLLSIPAIMLIGGPCLAASVPLASSMDPASTVSESTVTGETFVISNGDGTLANGKSGDDDSNPAFGDPVNLFPREADFVVGSLEFDGAAISGVGVETTPITALDLSELWSSDPNRTSSDPSDDATVMSDLSDYAIGAWLFNGPGSIGFGALDAADEVTFTDGVLTSIDFSVDATFSSDPTVWSGVLSAIGDTLSFQINDTQLVNGFFNSTVVFDLTGTIGAVGAFTIPEPTTLMACLTCCTLAVVASRRR